MGPQYKEAGGGAATGLSDQLIKALMSGITGSFGGGSSAGQANAANPVASTMGMFGPINDLLMSGGGKVGGAYSDLISKQTDRDIAALRARFGAGGGVSMGTPAAYAEGLYRANAAPNTIAAIGNLQMNALNSILPIMAGLAGKGIAQRQGYMQPSPLASGISMLGNLANTGLNMYAMSKMGGNGGNPGGGMSIPNITPGVQNTTSYGSFGNIGANPLASYGQNYGYNPDQWDLGSMYGNPFLGAGLPGGR